MTPASFVKMWRMRCDRDSVYHEANYWDSKASDYEGNSISMWPNDNLNQLYHQDQLRELEAFLPDMRRLSVLEAGCGIGRISRFLASRGAQVVGVDFSPKTVEIAQRLTPGSNPRYQVQSFFDLNFEGGFDALVTVSGLAIACRGRQELEQALRRFHRAVKPGGKLVLLEPVHRGFLHRVLDLDLQEFCQTMRQTGFEIQEIRQLQFWPARLALAYVRWPAWLTRLGYALGQGCMRLPGLRQLGDYKVIYATACQERTDRDRSSHDGRE